MKVSSSQRKHWPTKGSNSFSIELISSYYSITPVSSIEHSFKSIISPPQVLLFFLSFGNSFNSTQFLETLPWISLAINSSSICAILKQELKIKSISYYTINEIWITNKIKIIVPSWGNSFKSKEFIGTSWWVSLATKLSSICATLKQD